MGKRLLLLFGCVSAMLVVAYSMLWMTAPKYRIDQDGVEQIKVGMTEEEMYLGS